MLSYAQVVGGPVSAQLVRNVESVDIVSVVGELLYLERCVRCCAGADYSS